MSQGLTINLLGPPGIRRGGEELQSPRGHKPWALLAYVLLANSAPSRQRLASLLFEDADDPLGALRWSLSQLRRLLGPGAVLEGDPLQLDLPEGTSVDVELLSRGTWVEAVALPVLGRPLLEGVDIRSSPAFDVWLENERRHLSAVTEGVLHEAALACLARADTDAAVDHATHLVGLNAFDENAQVLLVRCLRAAGQSEAAERQIEACTKLFRSELGVEPSPALRIAGTPDHGPARQVESRSSILAKLEAGESAVAAGALQAGLEALRGAAASAKIGQDRQLGAEVLVALGSALVHAALGSDEEGVAALHQASAIAEELEAPLLAATALREIAWVDFLRGRYERAQTVLVRAAELAGDDDTQVAWIASVQGACNIDTGNYLAAQAPLAQAIERGDRGGTLRVRSFARNTLGKMQLLRGELGEARGTLDDAIELARADNWTSFIPFPSSLRAEVDLIEGDIDAADERFDHAFALGCQLGDPCWESLAARGLGLVAAARGDIPRALELLDDAPRRCRRLPDSYMWLEAYALDSLCAVAIEHDAPASRQWVDQLESIASRSGMRELVVRADLHRVRLGDVGAAEAARALAAGIDNPALEQLLRAAAA